MDDQVEINRPGSGLRLSRPEAWLLAGIALLSLVRVFRLFIFSLSPDEAIILAISRVDSIAGVWRETLLQAHPPFYFLLLHFIPTDNLFFLRLTSLAPGLLLIPVFFLLGRRAAGETAAWTMALMAAFGAGITALSLVLRPYSLLVLMLAGATVYQLAYFDRPTRSRAAGYIFCSLAALSLHYSAAIYFAAAGISGVAVILSRRRRFQDLLAWCGMNLPVVGLGIALYLTHLSRIPELRHSWIEGYLKTSFTTGPVDLIFNLYNLVDYLFYPFTPVIIILIPVGFARLVRTGRRETWVQPAILFILAVGLNLLDLYPLRGTRHGFYLFPSISLVAAAGIEEAVQLWSKGRSGRDFVARASSRRLRPALLLGLALLLAAVANGGQLWKKTRFRDGEFQITNSFHQRTFAMLRDKIRPEDIVITTRATSYYLKLAAGTSAETWPTATLRRVRFNGCDYYFLQEPYFPTRRDEIAEAVVQVDSVRPISPDDTVWLLDYGAGAYFFSRSVSGLFHPYGRTREEMTMDHFAAFSFPGGVVRAMLDNRRKAQGSSDPGSGF